MKIDAGPTCFRPRTCGATHSGTGGLNTAAIVGVSRDRENRETSSSMSIPAHGMALTEEPTHILGGRRADSH